MLLRAAFWIGVVALLMPHEPNLGFGRPNAQWWPGAALSWMDTTIGRPKEICQAGDTCKMVLQNDDAQTLAQNFAARGISEARAEIEQAERERAANAE
ncbi:MAG: hypothetical protein WBQ17_09795 [Rhizomicrobium sp.]|jgi:hypothetical protein